MLIPRIGAVLALLVLGSAQDLKRMYGGISGQAIQMLSAQTMLNYYSITGWLGFPPPITANEFASWARDYRTEIATPDEISPGGEDACKTSLVRHFRNALFQQGPAPPRSTADLKPGTKGLTGASKERISAFSANGYKELLRDDLEYLKWLPVAWETEALSPTSIINRQEFHRPNPDMRTISRHAYYPLPDAYIWSIASTRIKGLDSLTMRPDGAEAIATAVGDHERCALRYIPSVAEVTKVERTAERTYSTIRGREIPFLDVTSPCQGALHSVMSEIAKEIADMIPTALKALIEKYGVQPQSLATHGIMIMLRVRYDFINAFEIRDQAHKYSRYDVVLLQTMIMFPNPAYLVSLASETPPSIHEAWLAMPPSKWDAIVFDKTTRVAQDLATLYGIVSQDFSGQATKDYYNLKRNAWLCNDGEREGTIEMVCIINGRPPGATDHTTKFLQTFLHQREVGTLMPMIYKREAKDIFAITRAETSLQMPSYTVAMQCQQNGWHNVALDANEAKRTCRSLQEWLTEAESINRRAELLSRYSSLETG